jgi:hypothetical protein
MSQLLTNPLPRDVLRKEIKSIKKCQKGDDRREKTSFFDDTCKKMLVFYDKSEKVFVRFCCGLHSARGQRKLHMYIGMCFKHPDHCSRKKPDTWKKGATTIRLTTFRQWLT